LNTRGERPLVVHFVHRFDVGGLENGLVNLINEMPPQRYRHAIVSMTEHTDFRKRLRRPDVGLYALRKRAGKDPGAYLRAWRLLRDLRPDIVHTRNLATLDCQVIATAAGVPCRIHGEHGRDLFDLEGSSRKYSRLRRIVRPFVHRYVPLSRELEQWLQERIGVPAERITRIYNGVDQVRFHPAERGRASLPVSGFAGRETLVIGTVGRMEGVKDQLTLARAFLELLGRRADMREKLRLVLVGDGSLRIEAERLLREGGARGLAWLPGSRDDVAELLRSLDVFVLPSLAEGISNTILEAMASGLPVVATRVGGNAELIEEGRTGLLVPPADSRAMADALERYVDDRELAVAQGRAGRARIEQKFSLAAMVERYLGVYDALMAARGTRHAATMGRG
jgi:sugar transferase (PEP-CTERM/EpsH1 system associated)